MEIPNSKGRKRATDRCNADARILAVFEQSESSGKSFDYSNSVKSATESVPEEQITAYLSRIQRGGLIQPFGCMLAVEEATFRIIAYSENTIEVLGLFVGENKISPEELFNDLLGTDARSLFAPSAAASLVKAAASRDISLSKPILVHSGISGIPFYAILHRIDVGIVIDLEPASTSDPASSIACAVQSQKLALRAISRLQSLRGGDIGLLCDTVVEDVQQLTGYDRVMVYKFHEDEHGEVVSETRRSDLEPYLGLHYPATDIPQACRFLFKQNRVRMICDCHANPVRVIQDEELKQPLCLVNSTLRSPHNCHTQYMANMGSIASLVMAVIINGNDSMKLWGLLVCHHTSPRYVPFPIRYACEILMQVFGLQLNMELQLAAQLVEKIILRTQTLLCDMLLRETPFGIVTRSPNIMDLVKCDGAALYYGGTCWLLGVTPTAVQIKEIVEWFLACHGDATGFSTDSLADAGYPGAAALGDDVCGMATARITSSDFLFWFRSDTAKEIKWGGAKHHPEDEDDGGRMHPRSSFKAFLEVVKCRSLPWEVPEMNAIHSLQLIMRDLFRNIEDGSAKMIIRRQLDAEEMQGMEELRCVVYEMVKLIETASAPIFAIDSAGHINGWNSKVAELTGLPASKAMGKLLVHVVHEEYLEAVENHLIRALQGEEDKHIEFKLKTFGSQQQQDSAVIIVANACPSKDHTNKVVDVCLVGQDVTAEKVITDKFILLQRDYNDIVQSVSPLIPPIFASDQNTCCSEWNTAMEKLTGWAREEVIGKLLIGEIFGDLCQLKGPDAVTKFKILLYNAVGGQDTEKFHFGFFDRKGKHIETILSANKRTNMAGHRIGCFCFLQTAIPDLQALEPQQRQQSFSILKKLAYIRQQARNPLNGIMFTQKLLEATIISDDQKQFLATSTACARQMMKIIVDMDLESIDNGYMDLDMADFLLASVMDGIISQVMLLLREKNLQLIREIPEEIKTMSLHGDQIRLQQVLANFFQTIVYHAPSQAGWVEIGVAPSLKVIENGKEQVHLQFRMVHPGKGLPSELVQDMFDGGNRWATQEGLALGISQKLLKVMNGRIQYVRESTKCYFLINMEFQTTKSKRQNVN